MSKCILFQGYINPSGYGYKWYQGKLWYAHRLAWYLANGEIPKGMYVCHTCDVKACIRPDHLFLGTPSDNQQDAVKKGRRPKRFRKFEGMCQRGLHRIEPDQTKCRACKAAADARRHQRNKMRARNVF